MRGASRPDRRIRRQRIAACCSIEHLDDHRIGESWEDQVSLNSTDVGTATWTMQCKNYYISPEHWEYDSGTLEIT